MKKLAYLLLLITGVVFVSCKNETDEKTVAADETAFDYIAQKTDITADIDALVEHSGCIKYSMDYSKESKERYFATMYCDTLGDVLKMEELSFDAEGLYTKNIFYYHEDRLYMTMVEYQTKNDKNEPIFCEEITVFDKHNKIEKAFKKVVNSNEDEPQFLPSTENRMVKNDRIFKAINNEGEFEMTFQGIIKTDNLDYIMIGNPSENGFTTAFQIEGNSDFIKDIYVNERKYINRKIHVNFNRQVMGSFAYQAFVSAKWLD